MAAVPMDGVVPVVQAQGTVATTGPATQATAAAPTTTQPAPPAAATPVAATCGTPSRGKPSSFSVPILYGNSASTLPKDGESKNTHSWTVYLRSGNNTELHPLINKVVFKLHESFATPTRTITAPPFEVSEAGWGEFNVHMKIYFADPKEKPVAIQHFLKLYPNETTVQVRPDTIVSERYDELEEAVPVITLGVTGASLTAIVFIQSEPGLKAILQQPARPAQHQYSPTRNYKELEAKQFREYQAACSGMKSRVSHAKAAYEETEKQVARMRQEIQRLSQTGTI